MSNNPISINDPLGDTVVKATAMAVKLINARAAGTFGLKNGNLTLLKKGKGSDGHSTYYRDRLIKAINSPKVIKVGLDKQFLAQTNLWQKLEKELQ